MKNWIQRNINPFVLIQPDNHYWNLGDTVADTFIIGKSLKK